MSDIRIKENSSFNQYADKGKIHEIISRSELHSHPGHGGTIDRGLCEDKSKTRNEIFSSIIKKLPHSIEIIEKILSGNTHNIRDEFKLPCNISEEDLQLIGLKAAASINAEVLKNALAARQKTEAIW